MTFDPKPKEKRPSRDEWFLSLLGPVASRGTCPRRQVAAVVADVDGRVLSMGYNGVPSKMVHCTIAPCPGAQDASGDSRRCRAIHAEINALLQCTELRRAHTIYVSCYPCLECAKAIANTTIRRVVPAATYPNEEGVELLLDCGVDVVKKFAEAQGTCVRCKNPAIGPRSTVCLECWGEPAPPAGAPRACVECGKWPVDPASRHLCIYCLRPGLYKR